MIFCYLFCKWACWSHASIKWSLSLTGGYTLITSTWHWTRKKGQLNPVPLQPSVSCISCARSSAADSLPLPDSLLLKEKEVSFLTNKHIQKGCVVTHRNHSSFKKQDTPKNLSVEHQLFQEASLRYTIFKKTLCVDDEPALCSWQSRGAVVGALGHTETWGWSCRGYLTPQHLSAADPAWASRLGLPFNLPLKENIPCWRKSICDWISFIW